MTPNTLLHLPHQPHVILVARDPGGANSLLGLVSQALGVPPWQWHPEHVSCIVQEKAKARFRTWGVTEACFKTTPLSDDTHSACTPIVWSATSMDASWESTWWDWAYTHKFPCYVVIDQPRHVEERFYTDPNQPFVYPLGRFQRIYGSHEALASLNSARVAKDAIPVSGFYYAWQDTCNMSPVVSMHNPWYHFLQQYLGSWQGFMADDAKQWVLKTPWQNIQCGFVMEPFSLRDPVHCQQYGDEWDSVIRVCRRYADTEQTLKLALLKPHPYHTPSALEKGLARLHQSCPQWQYLICPSSVPCEWLLQQVQQGIWRKNLPWYGFASSVLTELEIMGARVMRDFIQNNGS